MISFDSGVISSSSSLAPFLSLMFIAEQPEDVKGGSSLARVCVCDIDSEILRSDGLAHSKGTVDLNISFL
jgi:hypothetical protein